MIDSFQLLLYVSQVLYFYFLLPSCLYIAIINVIKEFKKK